MRNKNRDKKLIRKKIFKNRKKIIIFLLVILSIEILLVAYFVVTKKVFNDDTKTNLTEVKEEVMNVDLYDYKITNRATEYEKKLFEELEKVLDSKEVSYDDYASSLTKLFITDLFTLDNKKSSSDIRSSQYVYKDYQETFKLMVKESLYSNIELDLDGTRGQKLPVVREVVVNSVTRESFSYNNQIIDNEAYHINVTINYEEDLGYATSGSVVLVKRDNLLEVVKLGM